MYREWEDSENRSLGYANNLAKPCALLQIKLDLWVKEGKAVPGKAAGVRTASRCAHTHKKKTNLLWETVLVANILRSRTSIAVVQQRPASPSDPEFPEKCGITGLLSRIVFEEKRHVGVTTV